MLEKIKEILGDSVKEVRLTDNLKTYPVCLISAGELSIEMEKVLNAMPNANQKVKADKILEISYPLYSLQWASRSQLSLPSSFH